MQQRFTLWQHLICKIAFSIKPGKDDKNALAQHN